MADVEQAQTSQVAAKPAPRPRVLPRTGIWPVGLTAAFLTAVLGLVTIDIEQAYLRNFPNFYDPVEYSFHAARLHERLAGEGRLSLAWQEWFRNPRNPLRTVPAILLAPELLAHPVGHMATTLPALFVFLSTLGLFLFRRTGSMAYSLAGMGLFCAIPGFFDPTLGLGANWLDLTASLLIGAACLCLLSSDGARDLRWLVGFAVLAAAAALCRYVAAGFVLFQAGPILAWLLFERWRKERDVARAVLAPMAVIGMSLAVLAGPFLFRHLGVNFFYYSELAYGLGQGPVAAARFLFNFLTDYAVDPSPPLAVLQVAVLTRVAIFPLLAFLRDRDRALCPLLISLWLGLSIPVFLIFVLQTPADPSAALYTLPGVFVALLAPTIPPDVDSTRRWLRRSATVLVCLAPVIGARAASAGWRWATHPSQDADFNRAWVTPLLPDLPDVKAFDRALAEALAGQGRGLVWNAFFDETDHIQTMEAFRRFGVLVLPAGPRYFSIHEPYWRGFYPGMSAPQVSERVYTAAREWVDIAVVLGDPARAETVTSRVNALVGNPFTRYVARDIAERVRADPRWQPVFELDSARYGRVVGYRNLAAGGRGYRAVLESHELFSSPIDP